MVSRDGGRQKPVPGKKEDRIKGGSAEKKKASVSDKHSREASSDDNPERLAVQKSTGQRKKRGHLPRASPNRRTRGEGQQRETDEMKRK